MSRMPSRKVGVESPVSTKTVAPRSTLLRGCDALSTPIRTPEMSQMTAAPAASETVTGSLDASNELTEVEL